MTTETLIPTALAMQAGASPEAKGNQCPCGAVKDGVIKIDRVVYSISGIGKVDADSFWLGVGCSVTIAWITYLAGAWFSH